ncbi:MAG: branched-chain amino acid ABC transporter permease [Actinomycetota bacterium]
MLIQYVANGLSTGFVIGLLALSVVMIYRSTQVLSFAQGAIASLSTYVFYQLSTIWEWPSFIALPVALTAGVAIGACADLVVMRPLRRTDPLTQTIATLGLVLVLQVVMRVGWQGETLVRPLSSGRLSIGRLSLGFQEIIIAAVALAAAALLAVWTRRSYRGLGLSAIAGDPVAARLLGVSPGRSSTLAWAIGGLLAALAGILETPLLVLNPLQMTLIMVTAFGAALLGAFVSLPLALAGGLLIGVVQSVGTAYLNVSGASETLGFISVFAVLMFSRGRQGTASLLSRGGPAW